MTIQNAEEASLSRRQAEIARMVVAGKTTREIAFALTLSPRTVETHIAAIYSKYGVSSRAELIIAVLGPGSSENLAVSANAVVTNLPARRAGLLGRATDVANLLTLLRENRLVTVTGAGGVGKTRVGLAVSEAALSDFKAGAWFVELALLARESSVADAIARALSIEPSPGVPPIVLLRVQLRRKSMLIILDNCEHLVIEAATVADTLLRDCPDIRILATSREPLRIAGERTYRLPSLHVPSGDSQVRAAARGMAYASIELFTQRAQAVDFDFTLTEENVAFVAQICRRVDGIPLAIELAAARVKILPVHALAAKLESHLRILGGGDRIAVPRHQTMHALIDWSFDLLEPAEQRLFERLSVFAGGCALPELVAVYGEDTVNEIGMLDILSSLVDKSLVVADATGPQPRYELLQTFAQYGMEKLVARSDAATVTRRFAVAYVELAERLEAEHGNAPSTSWYKRIEREIGNWRKVLDWTIEARHDVLLGQRLVAALRPVWRRAEGGQRWLRLARELIDDRTPLAVAAAVQFATLYIDYDFGAFEKTVADAPHVRELYERLGDPLRVARVKTFEGTALFLLGRVAEAEALLASALGVAREYARMTLVAYLLDVMAQISFMRGEILGGRAKYADAITIYESLGAVRGAAGARLNLADAEFGCGNIDEAVKLATSALITLRYVGVEMDIARALSNLAGYCIAANRWTAAHGYAREALQTIKQTQHQLFFYALGRVAAIDALAPDDTDRPAQRSRAARLLGYADARLRELGYTRQTNEQREYDRVLHALHETYAYHELVTQLASGAAMDPEQVIELAMSM